MWGNLNLSAAYAMAPEGMFINAPCPLIVPATNFLLGILNSNLSDFYIRRLGVIRNGGYFEYKPMFISQLPVPLNVDEKIYSEIENCVKIKNEELLNQMVYSLYRLNSEEIDFVEKGGFF